MATLSRIHLSGSTSGRPIAVAATTSPGTAIHTAVAGAAAFDSLYLWAANVTGTAATLTLQWGGTATADKLVEQYVIPANSPPMLLASGQTLNGGVAVLAYSGTANAINCTGYVDAIRG